MVRFIFSNFEENYRTLDQYTYNLFLNYYLLLNCTHIIKLSLFTNGALKISNFYVKYI